MADHTGKTPDPVSKKTKRPIALTGNGHSPFSVASNLIRPPAISSQNTPSREALDSREAPASKKTATPLDAALTDSLGRKIPLSSNGQGRTTPDKGVGPLTEKQEHGRDPALSDDGILLTPPIESSEGGETNRDGSRSTGTGEVVTFAAVYNGSLGLLASREHSAGELRSKLKKKYPEGEMHLDAVLERLQEAGLQNDERFAEMFVRYKANKGQGPAKIRHQLRAKSVDGAVISAALSDSKYDWSELAKTVSEKKFGGSVGEPLSPKERARRQRFLQGRGFGYEHIASAL
jgi:regulatory protein